MTLHGLRALIRSAALGLVVCGPVGVGAQQPPGRPLRPGEGIVDGYIGIALWPASSAPSGEPLSADGYTAHFIPKSHPSREIVRPAGRWLLLDDDIYRFWVEGRGATSADNESPLYFKRRRAEPQDHGLPGSAAVVAAGTIRVPDPGTGSGPREVRLLSIPETVARPGSYSRGVGLFARRASAAAAAHGVAMPAGQALVALYDTSDGRYAGLSRPVIVRAGGVTAVTPAPPRPPATHLMVRLSREEGTDPDNDDVSLGFTAGESLAARPPDVVARGVKALWAVWYDLGDKQGSVTIASKQAWSEPIELRLPPGRIVVEEGVLHPLPKLEVQLELPPELRDLPLALTVQHGEDGESAASRKLPDDADTVTFANLPAAQLNVVLSAGPWRFSESADLSDGEDGAVTIAPRALHVSGTVYLGDDPVQATVAFSTGGNRSTATQTDDDGFYRAVLFREGFYMATIRLAEGAAPFVEMPADPIEDDTQIDFHLPDNRYTVVVTAADDGTPVAGAAIGMANRAVAGQSSEHRVVAGEDGTAKLEPLRPGTLRLHVTAEGFRPADHQEDVPEDAGEREVRIALEREGEVVDVHLMLPDGAGAAGAEVELAPGTLFSAPVWSGVADGAGMLSIPRRYGGMTLLARHDDAGFLVTPFAPPRGDGEVLSLTLPRRAPDLTVRVVRTGGAAAPAPFVRLMLLASGARIAGHPLAWLTGSRPGSPAPVFTLHRLPEAHIALLAWIGKPPLDHDVPAGAYDVRATAIFPPWSSPLVLEAVEP